MGGDGGARFALLGTLEVRAPDGTPVDVGGPQPRLVLATLLLAGGRPVTAAALIDALWGERPPASASGTLQSYVSRLRRKLDEAGGARLAHVDGAYRIDLDDPNALDIRRFESLVDEGRALNASGDHETARRILVEADDLWRGPALTDLLDTDAGLATAARLEELRLAALEERFASDLALGRHAAVVGELAETVAAHPLREGFRVQLALALYRAGRQAEALRALSEASRHLREELGIEPSRPLRDLEAAILDHDPSLDLQRQVRPDRPAVPNERAAAVPPAAAATSLVGRLTELNELRAAYAEAAGDARIVIVEGEPGIGKTRLVDELRLEAEAHGSLAIWGRTDEGGAAPALWPWLEPLRSVAAETGASDVVAELLTGAVPLVSGQGAALQYERFDAVAMLLEQAGVARPVVVLLDDLQWADATSLELLSFLAGRLRRGVLIVATIRTLAVGQVDALTEALGTVARRPGSRRITLRGLPAADTAALLDQSSGQDVTAETARRIHDRAEGNPFYAIELARLVHDDGGHGEVPTTVGDVIRRRLARLPGPTVTLLEVAAVTGRDVEIDLLARSAELRLDECLDTVEPAVVQRLLVEVPEQFGRFRFTHALVREVLLDGLSSVGRARLHLKVADAIEAKGAGRDQVEILAEHLWRASGIGVAARAADALERAAEVAMARVAYAAAESLLLRAVQLRRATSTTADDRRAELVTVSRLLEVTQATRYFQGADREVLARARALADELGDQHLARTFAWYDWAALATSARVAEAAPEAEISFSERKDDPLPEIRSAGHSVAGTVAWQQGRTTEAVAHFDEAVRLLKGLPPAPDPVNAEQRLVTHTFHALVHGMAGDRSVDDVVAEFDAIMAASPLLATPSICAFAGSMATVIDRLDLVQRYQELALNADPAWQFAFWGGQLLMQRSVVEAWQGDLDAALASFVSGRELYTGIGGRSGLGMFTGRLARLLAEAGRLDDAARLAAAAREELDTYGERWTEVPVMLGEAAVARASGDPDRARAIAESALALAEERGAHGVAESVRRYLASLTEA